MLKNFDGGKWNYNIVLIYVLRFYSQESENKVDNFYNTEPMVSIVTICTTNDRHTQYSNSFSGKK